MLPDDDKAAVPDVPAEADSRKDRVAISLQLEVVGVDLEGRDFVGQARSKIVSRNGAAIVIDRLLGPDQTLTIKRVGTNQEAEVRIIGQIGREVGGNVYGVALVEPSVDIWGIDSPPSDSDETLIKILLECPVCHTRQIVPLHEFELSVLEAAKKLSRRCPKCHDTTLWKRSAYDVPPEPEAAPESAPAASAQGEPAAARKDPVNRRKHSRVKMKLKGCILFGGQETPIEVTDISRGGVRFRSRRNFAEGLLVRAAIPYSPGGANIFVSAKISWSRSLPSGVSECGLKYLKG
jgi:PilZ domain-containing protein